MKVLTYKYAFIHIYSDKLIYLHDIFLLKKIYNRIQYMYNINKNAIVFII